MRNYLFFLAVVLLTSGCTKEIEPTSPVPGKVLLADRITTYQTVTTIDGNTTNVGVSVETLPNGEIIQICKPANWNGTLILYAHGYVSEFEPLKLPQEAAAYVPLFTSLGYAFATTSYSENGLAIQSGITSILNLRERFINEWGKPNYIYLTGGSEGGILTTLAIERHPELFSGGLPLCGPCGDFQRQINYYGDFRVLFDYFFPGVLPGDATNIPDALIANWQTVYLPAALQAIAAKPAATLKLLKTSLAAYVPGDANSIGSTVAGVLWYSVFATRDATKKLGGQPFDNRYRVYFGTGSVREDIQLNLKVQRFSAAKKALQTVAKYYETSGKISRPLVMGHTTLDPIIPFLHLPIYKVKTVLKGTSLLFTGIPVQRYGHCNFQEAEIIGGFSLLVLKTQGQAPLLAEKLIDQSKYTEGKIVRSVAIN